ncbi:restriction endonuclease subunit S [Ensifer sp. OV372]|uniref:restriction endonuclease subunit S n=1 Tax=Ensifer sp. OV372 TaxID=1855293 RepID=UPI0008F3B5E2|nr:restriction endonuclease subunit S [Ensifer sp. OV372]SFG24297.1 type I restriction enzyme, S subunit [Ensifer sp. OV372]
MSARTARLDEVCQINPRTPKHINDDTPVTFLPMSAISEDGYVAFEEARTYGEVKKGYTYFERGDVLVAKITPCFENGKAASTETIQNKLGFGSTEFHVLRPSPDLDPKYAFYLLWSERFRMIGESGMTGSAGQKRVPADLLRRLEIPLPPLGAQKRIAAMLDKADQLRQKRRQAIALLDSLSQSIFLEMFGETASQGWPTTTIGEVATDMRTGPFGSQLLHSEFVDEGIAVLGIDNAVNNRFEWGKARFITEEKYRQLSRYTVRPDDVLITIMGTCGRCAVVPHNVPTAINTKHLCCITLDITRVLPQYLHACFLNNPSVLRQLGVQAKGAIMPGLNMGIIKSLNIAVPPIALQQAFQQRLALLSHQLTTAKRAADESDALFSSLQHRAFSGQL